MFTRLHLERMLFVALLLVQMILPQVTSAVDPDSVVSNAPVDPTDELTADDRDIEQEFAGVLTDDDPNDRHCRYRCYNHYWRCRERCGHGHGHHSRWQCFDECRRDYHRCVRHCRH